MRDQDPHRSAYIRRLHLGDGRRQEKGPLRVCLSSRPSDLCGERPTQQPRATSARSMSEAAPVLAPSDKTRRPDPAPGCVQTATRKWPGPAPQSVAVRLHSSPSLFASTLHLNCPPSLPLLIAHPLLIARNSVPAARRLRPRRSASGASAHPSP